MDEKSGGRGVREQFSHFLPGVCMYECVYMYECVCVRVCMHLVSKSQSPEYNA